MVSGTAFLGAVVLTHIQGGAFFPRLFQTMAAIGTVGLTTTPVADLAPAGLWLLLVLMYLGRVGILSFSLAFLTRTNPKDQIRYPTCDVMIG
jgi:trk system potassium uptake protein TrkH